MLTYADAQVETATLMSNTHALRRLITRRVKLCAVIKGNAFGHGLVPGTLN
jgi:alanine racemase